MVSRIIATLLVLGTIVFSPVAWAQNQGDADDIFPPDIGKGSPMFPEGTFGFGPGRDSMPSPPDHVKPRSADDLPIFPDEGSKASGGLIFPVSPDGTNDQRSKGK